MLKLFSQNNRALALIIGLGLFLSLIPFQLAMAGGVVEWPPWAHCAFWDVFCILTSIAEYTFSIPIRVGFFVLLVPLVLIALFAGLLFSLMVALCNWMIYICVRVGITPTNPLTPGVVTIGWTFTRDFVNMFFILILAFIGLATILKLREYEAKKLLPKLIIIALLINFTPVIVGFMVDMGNIVTNFFLSKAATIISFPDVLNLIWTYLSESLKTVFLWDGRFFEQFVEALGMLIGIIIYGVVVIIFFLLSSWIYFLIMIAFFLRIVELWILMILCPIAFFSQVLPPSKTVKMLFPSILHWDKWWEEFLQWIIWGIPMGFFLYLSNWIMGNTSAVEDIFNNVLLQQNLEGVIGFGEVSGLGTGLEAQFISLVTSILAPTVALVLLYKGYKIAKDTAPAAAKGIIEGVQKAGTMAAALGITAVTAGAGAGAAAGMLGKMAAGAKGMDASMGKIPIFGKALQYGVGKPAKWATRGMEMAAAPTLLEYSAKTRRVEIPEGFKDYTPDEQVQATRTQALTRGARIQYAAKMVELGTFDKTTDKEFRKETQKTAGQLIDNPNYGKYAETVKKASPDTVTEEVAIKAKLAGKVNKKDREKAKGEITKEIDNMAEEISKDEKAQPEIITRAKLEYNVEEDKVTAEMKKKVTRDMSAAAIYTAKELKPEDWSKMTKDSSKSLPVTIGSLYGDGRKLSKAAERFGPEFIDKYMEEANKRGPEWFVANNPRGLLYLSGNAAQDFGYTTPGEWSGEKVKEAIEYARKTKGEEKGKEGEEERPPYIV